MRPLFALLLIGTLSAPLRAQGETEAAVEATPQTETTSPRAPAQSREPPPLSDIETAMFNAHIANGRIEGGATPEMRARLEREMRGRLTQLDNPDQRLLFLDAISGYSMGEDTPPGHRDTLLDARNREPLSSRQIAALIRSAAQQNPEFGAGMAGVLRGLSPRHGGRGQNNHPGQEPRAQSHERSGGERPVEPTRPPSSNPRRDSGPSIGDIVGRGGALAGIGAGSSDRRAANSPGSDEPPAFEQRVNPAIVAGALKRYPDSPGYNQIAGIQAAADGDAQRAARHLDIATSGDDADPRALSVAAVSAFHNGEYEKARAYVRRARAGGQDYPILESVDKLARRRIEKGAAPKDPFARREIPDAAADVAIVVEGGAAAKLTPPERIQAAQLYDKALSAMRKRDYAAAEDLARRVNALAPTTKSLNIEAAALLKRNAFDDAIARAQRSAQYSGAVIESFGDTPFRRLSSRQRAQLRRAARDYIYSQRIIAAAEGGRALWRDMVAALDRGAAVERRAALTPKMRALHRRARRLLEQQAAALMAEMAGDLLGEEDFKTPPPPARRRPPAWAWAFSGAGAALIAGLWAWHLRRRKRGLAASLEVLTRRAAADGAPVDAFRIIRSAGMGGMGAVYIAYDLRRGATVALKTLRAELRTDPKMRARILREARIVQKLRHPGIVELYDVVDSDAGTALVFEHLQGEPLSTRLVRGALEPEQARDIIAQTARAIAFAHDNGVVHRDVKPSNIMLTDAGVKVVDFGLARDARADPRTTSAGGAGTPLYMAPEQEEGKAVPASDVYALGVTLYEMLTGERPFTGSLGGIGLLKRRGKFTRLSALLPAAAPELDALINRALAPDPDLRHKDAEEFAAAVEAAAFTR